MEDGSLLSAAKAQKVLFLALSYFDYDKTKYNMHSFWAGKCTDLAMSGAMETKMRLAGQWESQAFALYIKPEEVRL